MENIFFFQTQQIHDNTNLFDQLKKQNIYFSYFQVDQNYYLFVYADESRRKLRQKSIDINFLYQSIDVIQELDSKQRKIRSFRGFFLYALEIMEKGKDYEILTTNLQPFFWRKVKNIIRQNQKGALLEFLFGKDEDNKSVNQGSNPAFDDRIQNLQNQINSLQQKIIELEHNQNIARERNLNVVSEAPKRPKIDFSTLEQGDYALEGKKGPYLPQNDPKRSSAVLSEVRDPTSRAKDMESKTVSEAPRSPFKPAERSEEYNISSNQEKAQNRTNFITLGKISEQERVEIIQTGFQRQAEGKISLKKYYESTDQNSLFQSKGYSLKFESIRRTKLYQSLKE